MKRQKSFFALELFAALVILLVSGTVFINKDTFDKNGYYKWESGWSYAAGDNQTEAEVLPNKAAGGKNGRICLYNRLPDKIERHDVIGFYTYHQNVTVYINGELVYELSSPVDFSKTPGCAYNFVPLEQTMAGGEVEIILTDVYNKGKYVSLPEIFLGHKGAMIEKELARGKLFYLILNSIMLFTGVLLLFVWLVLHNKLDSVDKLFWLGLYAILFVLWSNAEMQIVNIYIKNALIMSWISYLCLKLMVMPLLEFSCAVLGLKANKTICVFGIASIADFFVTSILQAARIADYRETLFLTRIIISVGTFWVLAKGFGILLKREDREESEEPLWMKKRKKMDALFVVLLMILIILGITGFYTGLLKHGTAYTAVGIIAYVTYIGVTAMENAVGLFSEEEKTKIIKSIAVTDSMTKLNNRAGFNEELQKLRDGELAQYGIAMFDLNGLKFFNDEYGHGMGDYYIIVCSEIIQDIFGHAGTVFRLGGDEFCAILKDLSLEQYQEKSRQMEERIASLKNSFLENQMEVADGYARFNPKLDYDLHNTMERADKVMYEKKRTMRFHR